MALAGGPELLVAEAWAAVAARCWAGTLAGLARSSGQLARVGWPRKEAERGGK